VRTKKGGGPKRFKARREQDLVTLAALMRRGCTQGRIASELGITRKQVSLDMKLLRRQWREARDADSDASSPRNRPSTKR
jgi:hypothetical protein